MQIYKRYRNKKYYKKKNQFNKVRLRKKASEGRPLSLFQSQSKNRLSQLNQK